LVLVPIDIDSGKRTAADTAAFPAAIIAISGCIKKNSVVSFLSGGREEHWRLSFSSLVEEVVM
jgi:hypothetical protein